MSPGQRQFVQATRCCQAFAHDVPGLRGAVRVYEYGRSEVTRHILDGSGKPIHEAHFPAGEHDRETFAMLSDPEVQGLDALWAQEPYQGEVAGEADPS
jgi:hypothetical protein